MTMARTKASGRTHWLIRLQPQPRTSLIDPDDRQAFLEAVVRMFFSAAPVRESLIVKVTDVGRTALQVWGGEGGTGSYL